MGNNIMLISGLIGAILGIAASNKSLTYITKIKLKKIIKINKLKGKETCQVCYRGLDSKTTIISDSYKIEGNLYLGIGTCKYCHAANAVEFDEEGKHFQFV